MLLTISLCIGKDDWLVSRLYTEQVNIKYSDRLVVENLNLSIPTGQTTALIGANGSGKSTILKTLARIMRPYGGSVYLDGKSIHQAPTKVIAKHLAILPQNPTAPDGLTIYELVSYGRFPHQSGWGALSKKDKEIIAWAMEVTGLIDICQRSIDQLSGGQRQRAWIAMALAQQTDILLLDEPTTFLDMAHQLEVLELLDRLNKKEQRTIVMVVHDLNHASQYAQKIVAIKQGKIVAEGSPAEVITKNVLREVFGVEADIYTDARTGVPVCIPYRLLREETSVKVMS